MTGSRCDPPGAILFAPGGSALHMACALIPLPFGPAAPLGQKSAVPIALQLPLPSGTACQLPPPLGEEAFWLAVFIGDRQPIRLLL